MIEHNRIDDFEMLIAAANEALAIALRAGSKHKAGTWLDQTTGEHYNHLSAHFRQLQNGNNYEGENHLAHLICRAIMAYVRRSNDEAKMIDGEIE